MKIEKNISLQPYNSFGFDSIAENLIRVVSVKDVEQVIANKWVPIKILGGGSNILLTSSLEGYLLKNEITGIKIIEENQHQVFVQVGSGENWHSFVLWCLCNNFGGLENLSLIPGSVGAAPIQNIGAYGVEQKSCFHHLEAIHLLTGERKSFSPIDCQFGYRDSVFKQKYKNQYFITSVTYVMQKSNHELSLQYGEIQTVLEAKNIINPTIRDVSNAVIQIRQSKLPNPKEIGNAGSFFKNPVIDKTHLETLKKEYPNLPSYATIEEGKIKIPAGWLIDHLGYKGFSVNNVGVHKNQALVLVHYKNGQGVEILKLSKQIQNAVKHTFNIDLEPEVNIW
ncbi:MAG: UDP-N-acetylmuramate dehydrogenase [Saprospiraceae bacterium]